MPSRSDWQVNSLVWLLGTLLVMGCGASRVGVEEPAPPGGAGEESPAQQQSVAEQSEVSLDIESRNKEPVRPQRIIGTGHVTRYDLATREELFLSRPLRKLFVSDAVEEWPIVRDLADHVGDWVTRYLDARLIAEAITSGMPLAGQRAAGPLNALVGDCARTLDMESPAVFVRNDPRVDAYSGRSDDRVVLILTSGLLDLYEGEEDELRFIIGRELGHAKCGHIRMRQAAYGILAAIRLIDLQLVPDEFQRVLPSLAAGRFFRWCREAESSADRAGLLCCGNPDVAFAALQRQLHGLRSDSLWIDPHAPDFDPDVLLEEYRHWENRPFVQFVRHVKNNPQEAPFIAERIAALKLWAKSRQYEAILTRRQPSTESQLVTIQTMALADIGTPLNPVDVYVVVYDETDTKVLRTKTGHEMTSVTWRDINVTRGCVDQQPLFFEVWQDGTLGDTLLGGFVVYLDQAQSNSYRVPIHWDWEKRSTISRTALARVEVEFGNRAE